VTPQKQQSGPDETGHSASPPVEIVTSKFSPLSVTIRGVRSEPLRSEPLSAIDSMTMSAPTPE